MLPIILNDKKKVSMNKIVLCFQWMVFIKIIDSKILHFYIFCRKATFC